RRPQIRQGCSDTNLQWVLSRNRRGSGNASRLLSTRLETDTSLGSAAGGFFGKRVWPRSEDEKGALIASPAPVPRVAIFAANASSTLRASAAARLFFAAMIRCAHAAAASPELRRSKSVRS